MASEVTTIFLADDDEDDRLVFREALKEIALPTQLTTVDNGEQLLHMLESESGELPHVVFLDLNMPRKNGIECLEKIKQNEKLKDLSVVIFSTSFQPDVVEKLHTYGARHYVRKPSDFTQLKNVILQVLTNIKKEHSKLAAKANYVLS